MIAVIIVAVVCFLLTIPAFLIGGIISAFYFFFHGGIRAVSHLWNKTGEDLMAYLNKDA